MKSRSWGDTSSIHHVILCPGASFNKLVCGRWDVILSLVSSLNNPLVKAWASSLSFGAYKAEKNFLGEQTYKPSSVPRPGRGGDHPSSSDVTIRVKRPTQGSRPSTLNLSRSPQTSGQLRPLIRSCSGRGLPSQPVSQLLVSSCLAISPLPVPARPAAGGVFLWHFP